MQQCQQYNNKSLTQKQEAFRKWQNCLIFELFFQIITSNEYLMDLIHLLVPIKLRSTKVSTKDGVISDPKPNQPNEIDIKIVGIFQIDEIIQTSNSPLKSFTKIKIKATITIDIERICFSQSTNRWCVCSWGLNLSPRSGYIRGPVVIHETFLYYNWRTYTIDFGLNLFVMK